MKLLASLFVGKPQNIIAVTVVFLAGYVLLRFMPIGNARHPRPLLIVSTAWGLFCSMGVAGSDKDSGSEHPGRPSRDLSGAGNSLGVGVVPTISIDTPHRSSYGCDGLKTGCSGRC